MALDKFGRVIVNPNTPMGVTDFQRLYMGEGNDPRAAAGNIHVNYPTEAKSYMDQQWKALGINDSPENYFSRPENLTMLQGGGTDMAIRRTNTALGNRLPDLAAQSMAPNVGKMTGMPNMGGMGVGSNMVKLAMLQLGQKEEQAGQILEAQPQADIRADVRKKYSMPMSSMNDAQLRAAQMAGSQGFAKRFLAKQSGIEDYEEWLNRPQGDPGLERVAGTRMDSDIRAYRPELMGPLAEGTGRLDQRIYGDKAFQELMSRDPEQAAFEYQSLTGRALKGDYDETMKLRADNESAFRSTARRNIDQGAYKDQDGHWMLWGTQEAPEGAGTGLQGPGRPYRQLRRATKDEQYMMDTGRKSLGLPDEVKPTFGAKESRDVLRQAQKDVGLNAWLEREKKRMGGDLFPAEILKIKHDYEQNKLKNAENQRKSEWLPWAQEGLERGFRIATGLQDNEVIERGNSPLVDFADEYLGTNMGNRSPIPQSTQPVVRDTRYMHPDLYNGPVRGGEVPQGPTLPMDQIPVARMKGDSFMRAIEATKNNPAARQGIIDNLQRYKAGIVPQNQPMAPNPYTGGLGNIMRQLPIGDMFPESVGPQPSMNYPAQRVTVIQLPDGTAKRVVLGPNNEIIRELGPTRAPGGKIHSRGSARNILPPDPGPPPVMGDNPMGYLRSDSILGRLF